MEQISPLCSIVVLNFNGKDFLDDCFTSLSRQCYRNYEVFLVDNASSDGSVEFVEKKFPWVKIIANSENYGFAEGNNIGIKNTQGDYIIFLNNDTEVEATCIEEMVKLTESDSTIGICGCKILQYNERNKIDVMGLKCDIFGFPYPIGHNEDDFGQYDEYVKTRNLFVLGAALLVKREVLNRVGGFDPRFFILTEDMDLCWRTRLLGYKLVIMPRARVYHRGSGEMKNFPRSQTRYLSERNTIRMLIKNYSGVTLFKILPMYFYLFLIELIFFILIGKYKIAFADIRAVLWNIKNIKETWQLHRGIQRSRILDDKAIQSELEKKSFKFELFNKWRKGEFNV